MVEPPSAYTTVTAFSSALRVTMSRAVMPILSSRNRAAAVSRQSSNFCGPFSAQTQAARRGAQALTWSVMAFSRVTAGCAAVPGSAMPSASTALAMVQAVNMAEQVPEPGSEWHSILYSSSTSITPVP